MPQQQPSRRKYKPPSTNPVLAKSSPTLPYLSLSQSERSSPRKTDSVRDGNKQVIPTEKLQLLYETTDGAPEIPASTNPRTLADVFLFQSETTIVVTTPSTLSLPGEREITSLADEGV
ncbi:hypothetical protein NPIL_144151 [Nephila pilipes]|uniref:Uncharacterized protein n=1 Tax=Nephila pilipes TaxID=299642 RepID=A0A8X6TXV9_NEPPI|nr:hypothetical protein NPIL_144151 [Nephila pilipes]